MAVRNDLLIAPERPLRVAAPPRLPAPLPGVPWWSGRPAPHDRPDRPEGVERWRSDLVVAVPTSRLRRRGLVLLRPLAALPVLVLLVALRLAVLVALPVAWGCRVVANDLPRPLARGDAYLLMLSDHRPRLPEIAPCPPSGAPGASCEPHQPRSGLRSRRRRSDPADDPGECARDRAPDRPVRPWQ